MAKIQEKDGEIIIKLEKKDKCQIVNDKIVIYKINNKFVPKKQIIKNLEEKIAS